MTTDFRALCAEFVEAFTDENTYTQRVEILDRARTALATPPPTPTDEELWAIGSDPGYARAALERWRHG